MKKSTSIFFKREKDIQIITNSLFPSQNGVKNSNKPCKLEGRKVGSYATIPIRNELRQCTQTQSVVVWRGGAGIPHQNSLLPKPRGKLTPRLLCLRKFSRRLFDVAVLSCSCSNLFHVGRKVIQLPEGEMNEKQLASIRDGFFRGTGGATPTPILVNSLPKKPTKCSPLKNIFNTPLLIFS